MKALLLVLASLGILTCSPGYAQSGADVVKAKGCLNCHEADKKKIGPSFKDIAAKYKGDKDAEGKLVALLKDGKGHMKITASDAEIKTAVQHMLSTK